MIYRDGPGAEDRHFVSRGQRGARANSFLEKLRSLRFVQFEVEV